MEKDRTIKHRKRTRPAKTPRMKEKIPNAYHEYLASLGKDCTHELRIGIYREVILKTLKNKVEQKRCKKYRAEEIRSLRNSLKKIHNRSSKRARTEKIEYRNSSGR